MISTVTTSTVSTVTTASMVASIGLIVILVLFILLAQKELAILSSSGPIRRLSRSLNVGIIPLVIAFLMTVVVRITEILR